MQVQDSENDNAISVKGVSKVFRLPHNRQNSLKGTLINLIGGGDRTFETQEVLKNVSFEIKKGEFFGIVGRNGSGKSTLLKMLAGIYKPTSGEIMVNGSLTPFIELGVGFNPELTGRENVYLNGALLGFNDREVSGMYDDIVAFAELERFMDQKLKNYSSGMQVRLAFSIAIRARSDILLLDEVLAVGDEAFQRKCFDYFETLRRNKKTVILVTHDMSAVEKFCTRAMFIENGKVQLIGKPHSVAAAYSRSNNTEEVTSNIDVTDEAPFEIAILNENGKKSHRFMHNEEVFVKVSWPDKLITSVSVTVYRQSGERIFWTGTYQDGFEMNGDHKSVKLGIKLNLSEGVYFVAVSLWKKGLAGAYSSIEEGPKFTVDRNPDDTRWEGLTRLDHGWRY